MIEVIKEGVIKYKWICAHCACEFIAEKTDEKHEKVYDNSGVVWNSENTIVCPTCRRKLSDTMLPRSKREVL